jgi:hypothetical protein
MERLFKQGERIENNVNVGDIIEITRGVFIKVKRIHLITEEDLAGVKKTNITLKGEIISDGKERNTRSNQKSK